MQIYRLEDVHLKLNKQDNKNVHIICVYIIYYIHKYIFNIFNNNKLSVRLVYALGIPMGIR